VTAFVVYSCPETDMYGTKSEVIGPFADADTAGAFLVEHWIALINRDDAQGIAVVVDASTADFTPEAWVASQNTENPSEESK
jgi:hypothetical protein